MNYIIRKMTENDREEVLKMMRIFYDSDAVFHTSSDKVLKQDIDDCISDMPFLEGFVFSGEKGTDAENEIAGYAMTTRSYTTEYGGISVWLEDLYIKEEYRHQGISVMFFEYIEKYYEGAVRFKLEVEKENVNAIAAYKKSGYGISPYFEMTKEMIVD